MPVLLVSPQVEIYNKCILISMRGNSRKIIIEIGGDK